MSGGESEVDENVVEELHEGQYQLVFFSPESLLIVEAWRDMLQTEIDYNSNKIYFKFYCN